MPALQPELSDKKLKTLRPLILNYCMDASIGLKRSSSVFHISYFSGYLSARMLYGWQM